MDALIFFSWVVLAFVLAAFGAGKRIGFWGTLLISLIFSPLMGLIVLLFSSPKSDFKAAYLFIKAGKKRRSGDINGAIENINQCLIVNPSYPLYHYTLATYQSLNNNKKAAFHSLNQAIELGFSDFDKIKKDSDLTWLRNQPEFSDYRKFKEKENHADFISLLKELNELKQNKIITKGEFIKQKARILQGDW